MRAGENESTDLEVSPLVEVVGHLNVRNLRNLVRESYDLGLLRLTQIQRVLGHDKTDHSPLSRRIQPGYSNHAVSQLQLPSGMPPPASAGKPLTRVLIRSTILLYAGMI